MQHINNAQWNEMVELLDSDFKDLIQGFLLDCQNRLITIKEAQKNNDNNSALDAAHVMKGASLNIGANKLAHHCEVMQKVCHADMLDEAINIVEDIEKEYSVISTIISERLEKM